MRKINFNPEGTYRHVVVFSYFESVYKKQGTFPVAFETAELDTQSFNYDALEASISDHLTKTMGLSFVQTKPVVRIFSFVTELHAVASGTLDEKPILVSSRVEGPSQINFVGGTILERDEVLRRLNGNLAALQKLPPNAKGIATIVPGLVFPYFEGVNTYIERKTSPVILLST